MLYCYESYGPQNPILCLFSIVGVLALSARIRAVSQNPTMSTYQFEKKKQPP